MAETHLPRSLPDRSFFLTFPPKGRGTSASPSPYPHLWPPIFPGTPYALLSSHLFFLLVLLLLTQGIHPNPGPHPCSVCSLPVTWRCYSFLCSMCNAWTHKQCSGLRSIHLYSADWICPTCRRPDPAPPLGILPRLSPLASAPTSLTAIESNPAQLNLLPSMHSMMLRLPASRRLSYQRPSAPLFFWIRAGA
jgi:hypothetical protein